MSHASDGAGVPLDPETADEVARLMHVLSARSRVLILGALRYGPLPVGDLAAAVGMQGSAVSQQLRVLRLVGLVVGERRGRHVHYALHDPHVATLLDEAASHVAHRHLGLRDPVAPVAAGRVA